MSGPEKLNQPAHPDIRAALGAIGMGMGPLTRSRRIIVPAAEGHVVEFYSSYVGGRVLAMPAGSEDSARHAQLEQRGLPVFQTVDLHDGFTFLQAPLGTYSLRSRLALASQDLGRFGGLLTDLTRLEQLQYDIEVGVTAPSDVPLLDRFAVVVETGESASGLSPYLIPPYGISEEMTPKQFADALIGEITESRIFEESQLPQVGEYLQRGVRQEQEGIPGGSAS